jgi:hypothetical protein
MVYNPGGQLGKSVQGGGQRPAKEPNGPFLGKGATSRKTSPDNSNPDNPPFGSNNSRQTGAESESGKKDARKRRI